MKLNDILGALVGRLIAKLPFSLFAKLADGKMTKEEFAMLKDEVVADVVSVMNEIALKNNIVK